MTRRQIRFQVQPEMQMEPMVDVVFQLLVFFIFAFQVRVMEQHYWVRLAAAEKSAKAAPEKPLKVELQARPDGQLAELVLAGQRLDTLSQLESALRQRPRPGKSAESTVFVKPVALLKYKHVVEAAMVIRHAGWGVSLLGADGRPGSTSGESSHGSP